MAKVKVKECIRRLNADMQKTYYDSNDGFFSEVLPQKLENIKTFMTNVVNSDPRNPKLNIIKRLNDVDEQIRLISDKVNDMYTQEPMKDHYLNLVKDSVSQILLVRFYGDLFAYHVGMLENLLEFP
jgi:hypothetical protein